MRLYTLAEARATLPRLLPGLESARNAYVRLRALQAAPAADAGQARADGHVPVDPRASTAAQGEPEVLQDRVQAAVRLLGDLGIELKDPARGLIDFYHLREGDVVYLCYQLGEPDILFWHTLGDGFAGRRPL